MKATRFFVVFLAMIWLAAAQESTEYVGVYLRPFPGPQVYKDPNSGTLLYVETDGRHVAAISGEGKLLWNRDPFKDAHLSFYRTEKPQIVYIGPIKKSAQIDGVKPDKFVGISFNSSQFGLLRISNGEFQFLGQD
jgi:hypothetical protein